MQLIECLQREISEILENMQNVIKIKYESTIGNNYRNKQQSKIVIYVCIRK